MYVLYVTHCVYLSLCIGTVEPLTIGAAVGIIVACIVVVIFITGIVAALLMYHCINKHRVQNCKSESLFSYQLQQAESSSSPLQQTDQEYADVIKLKQNKAYELTQNDFEMRTYWPIQQHWFCCN